MADLQRLLLLLLLGVVITQALAATVVLPGVTQVSTITLDEPVTLSLAFEADDGSLLVDVFSPNIEAVSVTIFAEGISVGMPFNTFASNQSQEILVPSIDNSTYIVQLSINTNASVQVSTTVILKCNETAFLGQTDDGMIACIPCPRNSVVTNATSGCVCTTNFYSATGQAPCLPCSTGINCQSTFGAALADLTAEPGYALVVPTNNPSQVLFVPCPLDNSCQGGLNSSCGDLFEGFLCASCAPGFYRLGFTCKSCFSSVSTAFGLAWVLFFIMCSFCFLLSHWFANYSVLPLIADYAQAAIVIAFFQHNAPSVIKDAFWYLSVINFNWQLAQPECAQQPFTWFYVAMPFLMPLAAVLFYAIVVGLYMAYTAIRQITSEDRFYYIIRVSLGAFVTLMDLMYLSLVFTAIQLLQCTTLSGDTSQQKYWLYNYSLVCSSSDPNYVALRGVGVAGVVVYLVFYPAIILAFLYYKRKSLENEHEIRLVLGPLYSRYQTDDYWWWPCVVYVRRALLVTIVSQLASYNIVTAGVLVLFVYLLDFMANISFHPHKRALANTAHGLLTALLYIFVFLILFFFRSSFSDSVQAGVVLTVFLVTILLGIVILVQEIVWVHELPSMFATTEPEEYAFIYFSIDGEETPVIRLTTPIASTTAPSNDDASSTVGTVTDV